MFGQFVIPSSYSQNAYRDNVTAGGSGCGWMQVGRKKTKPKSAIVLLIFEIKLETTSENADSMITGRLDLWAIVAPRCADIRYINLICTRTCTRISSKRTLLNRDYPYFKVIVPALV